MRKIVEQITQKLLMRIVFKMYKNSLSIKSVFKHTKNGITTF
jgi:hypothetical protein